MYRKSTRHRLVLAILVAATATVLTLDFRQNPGGPIRRIQDGAISIVAPLQRGVSRVLRPVGSFIKAIGELSSLRSENGRLRARVAELQANQRDYPELSRENQEYRALLQEKDWKSGRKLGARLIGVGPSNHEWTGFLDRGKAEGVAEQMPVVNADGLIGRVLIASEHYSKVLFIVDPQHSVGARLSASGDTGVVTGRGSEEMPFEFIHQDTQVAQGEAVVTSGYDKGIYPAGIPIGRVTRVQVAKDQLSKTAYVRPFVDFSRLDTVLILLDARPSGSLPS